MRLMKIKSQNVQKNKLHKIFNFFEKNKIKSYFFTKNIKIVLNYEYF